MQVTDTPLLVGRSSHCQLVIDDPSVSSSHAELVRRNGVVFIRDLNSTNGTAINGTAIQGESTAQSGATIQFGLVEYVLVGNDLVEASQSGRTQIVGGAPRAQQDPAQIAQTATVPPPPPTQGSLTSETGVSNGLVLWLKGLLWGYVGLLGVVTLSTILIFVYFEQYMSAPIGTQSELDAANSWSNWETFYGVVYLVAVLLTLPIGILLIVWSHKAHRASDSLQPGQRKWGHGWSIGAWFIPVANYILVPLMLSEIHKISSAPRNGNKVSDEWPRNKVSAPLIMWFIFYAVGGVLLFLGNSALTDPFASADAYRGGLIITLIALGVTAAASMLAATFIKDVSTKLAAPRANNS